MLRMAWVLALALMAGPAFALGLGQIEVRSQRDQPLLAEIPIISSDPAELEQLQARLASPDTFARIGLEPPRGVVSGLQFTVALDARGQPVIRVTSDAPVQQSLLTFLVEVDWGQGRLVREYSALLDAPRTVAAPAQPPIQAPAVAPSSTIIRAPQPVAAEPAKVETAPAVARDAPAARDDDVPVPPPAPAREPAPESIAVAPERARGPLPAPAPAVASDAALEQASYGPVGRGDTLARIAAGMAGGHSLDQTMLALLRVNPDAFIGGNINQLRQGAVLRVPSADEITALEPAEAAQVVRDQVAQWRQASPAAPQPAAIAGDAPPAGERQQQASTARVADARLEIVPPSQRGGRQAGTRSGIEAGGEGEMLRQELQETRETLAARDSEVEELKARLADLESLQQQQQQLLTLKDSEIAAAQQRLAASNAASSQPATTTSDAGVVADAGSTGGSAWLVGALLLVALAALVGWLWSRRRREPQPRRVFDTQTLAAGMPLPRDPEVRFADDGAGLAEPTFAGPARAPPPATPAANDIPEWNGSATVMPTWHGHAAAGTPTNAVAGGPQVPAAEAAEASERLELARAYLDLGDVDTARHLLQEVVQDGDPGASAEASQLIRELG